MFWVCVAGRKGCKKLLHLNSSADVGPLAFYDSNRPTGQVLMTCVAKFVESIDSHRLALSQNWLGQNWRMTPTPRPVQTMRKGPRSEVEAQRPSREDAMAAEGEVGSPEIAENVIGLSKYIRSNFS